VEVRLRRGARHRPLRRERARPAALRALPPHRAGRGRHGAHRSLPQTPFPSNEDLP
jgi:hypothetical protein